MPGNDEIYGEAGEDTIIGGSGADILGGARDNDSIVDGPEDDAAFDDISSGEGNDEITSANIPASKDSVFCGGGTDVVDDDCEKVSRLQNEAQVLAEDTQVYAQMEGVSEQEAARRMELEEDVGDLNAALEANEAATFGGLELADGADFGVVTYFTENGQQTAEDYVAGTPLEGTVEARTVDASLADLVTAQADAIAAYEAQNITADTDINVPHNRVEMYVTEGDQTQSRAVAQDVAAPLPGTGNVVSITVEELSKPDAAFYAGFKLRISNEPSKYCTSGFTVRHNGGAEGALTAGHCPPHNARTFDDNRQLWHGGDIMPYVSQDRYGGQDLQWHLTPGYEDRAWFWSATGVRGVTGTRGREHQFIDNKVCKFGQTTGVTCGRINGRNFKPWWVGERWGTFMRVERNGPGAMSDGGDSGGPVYWGNTALGVHSGTYYGDGIYTAINFVQSSDMGIRCVQKSNKTC